MERLTGWLLGALWVGFAAASATSYWRTGGILYVGLLATNLATSWLFVTRRPPGRVAAWGPAWGWALAGTFLPFGLRPTGQALPPGVVIEGGGIAITLWALVSLGPSFGLVAAHRGLRLSGAYRFIRHPLYAAELVTYGGIGLAYPSVWNAGLWGLLALVQLRRAVIEERLLGLDPAYLEYQRHVPGRFVPRPARHLLAN